MNSISFLDGVLTRSLSSSRRQSGSNTPSKSSASAGPSSSSPSADAAAAQDPRPLGRGPHRIDRRASDYSLAARGDRERRRLALGLELTPVDAPAPVQRTTSGLPSGSSSSARKQSRSTSSTPANLSRRSSTSRRASSSARRSASEADGGVAASTQTQGEEVSSSSSAAAPSSGPELLPSPLPSPLTCDEGAQGASSSAANDGARPSLSAQGRSASASASRRHPKSASDGPSGSEARARRKALKRSGSTPAPVTTASRARWSTLWGLGTWLEGGAMDGGGLFGDAGAASSHARRSASESYAGPDGSGRRKRRASSGSVSVGRGRRHRYESEDEAALAEAAAAALAPELLMSQQEREDVVDFEGGEMDEEEEYLSGGVPHVSAPQPTPAIGISSSSGRTSVPSTPPPKLGSFLFGALASRVDDYFGPQPIHAATIDASNGSPRLASAGSSAGAPKRSSAKTTGSPPSTPPRASRRGSTASSRQLQHGRVVPLVDAQIQTAEGEARRSAKRASREASTEETGAAAQQSSAVPKATTTTTTTAEPSDPPPPYTPTPSDSPSSSTPSSPVDEHAPARSGAVVDPSGSAATSSNGIVNGAARHRSGFRAATSALRRLWELLRRAIMAILLAPLRAVGLGPHRKAVLAQPEQHSPVTAELPTLSYDGVARAPGEAQAKKLSTAEEAEEEQGEEDQAEEELITEDQAAARAERIAAKEARHRARQAQLGIVPGGAALAPPTPPTPGRTQSRLLPSPHAIDPLLMHNKKKLRRAEEEEKSGRKQHQPQAESEKEEKRLTIHGAATAKVRGATRGANTPTSPTGAPNPTSSIIHHSPKILVLDLDETLIHSTSRSPTWSALRASANGGRGARGAASISTGGSLLGLEGIGGMLGLSQRGGVRPHMVEVVLDGRSVIYHVYKRPWVDHFLRKVAQWYHVVIFTASVQEYADPVIDWLDQGRGLISGRLFREACTYKHGSYLKDLTMVSEDLSRVCLLDNSPASYLLNQANGIPIEGWTSDDRDTCLLDLLPVLDALRFASDVRHVLSLRGF